MRIVKFMDQVVYVLDVQLVISLDFWDLEVSYVFKKTLLVEDVLLMEQPNKFSFHFKLTMQDQILQVS